VLGAEAPDLGLPIGDTLPEMPKGAVPREVAISAEAKAGAFRMAPECNRYFGLVNGDVVVIFVVGCSAPGYLNDGTGAAVYSRSGALVGKARGSVYSLFSSLQPHSRAPQR